jgi:hypothetical protein
MAFQYKQDNAPDGSSRAVAWDDELGHSPIWEYDAQNRLAAFGVVTHSSRDRWQGDIVGEAVWYDPDGVEKRRGPITRTAGTP